MYTIGIATNGFITDSNVLTLTLGTKGFLYDFTVPIIIPPDINIQKSGSYSLPMEVTKQLEGTKKQWDIDELLHREDEEILLIIKMFVQCQN